MKTIQSKLLLIFGAFLLLASVNLFLVLTSGQEEAGRVIDLSGKQRMLSQRLAKASLELVINPESESAKTQLEDTAALFEKIQAGLTDGSSELGLPAVNDSEIRAQLDLNKQKWSEFRSKIQMITSSRMDALAAAKSLTYLRDNNGALLAAAAKAVKLLRANNLIQDNQIAAAVIDMAGRQRMLTQKISKAAFVNYEDPSNTKLAQELAVARRLFDNSLNTLINGGADDMSANGSSIPACADPAARSQLNATKTLWTQFQEQLDVVANHLPARAENFVAAEQIATLSVPLLVNLNKATQLFTKASANAAQTLQVSNIGVVVAMLLAVLFGWFMVVTPLVQTLRSVIDSVARGADEINGVAGQVLQASQELATSSSEQAANVQEVSASMEEMAAMTRQNAEHAVSANNTVDESRQAVGAGGEHVRAMAQAMGNINQASEEIGQILTTIQDIAFQTNLLAVNAAIEAAGAGEAGSRFAMVADEVRNLSRRSANAAKESETLIKTAIERVHGGASLVRELQQSFTQVQKGSGKVASLVTEIRAASSEQARGVDEVNRTVMGLDSIAQRNSSFSEQSSSAAAELDAQCQALADSIGGLTLLIHASEGSTAKPQAKAKAQKPSNKSKGGPQGRGRPKAEQKPQRAQAAKQTKEPVAAEAGSDADGFVRF